MAYYRCTDCENEQRGIEHRELINERCKPHALAAIVNKTFVEVSYISDRSGIEYRVRGLLHYYPASKSFSIKKYARRSVDHGRHTPAIEAWQLRAIRPVSDVEQAQDLPVGTLLTIEHFGQLYNGRVVERKRTRVLVRFRARNERLYDRWKSVFAVQHINLPTTAQKGA